MAIIAGGVNLEDRIKDLKIRNAVANLKNAATSSLAKYDLADQVIDDFQDATGIDASASTNESFNSAGFYYHSVTGGGFDSNVKLLLHFENNLADSSGNDHAVTNASGVASNVTFNSSYVKPATGSSYSADFGDGVNRKLTVTASSDFLFGTDPWSFDCWIYFKNNGELINTGHPTWRIMIESLKLKFVGAGIDNYFSNDTFSTNTWYWIAIQRSTSSSTSNVRSWVNGSHWGTQTIANTNDLGSSSNALVIGHTDSYFGQYMDELRLSKGIARWPDTTADISIPTSIYATESITDMTLVSTATTASSVPTKGDLLFLYEDATGTATVNTDIKGYISRNNGTTYTEGTLVSEGALGTSKIVAFHDLDISGQSSATAMRYKITTHNQASDKKTRISGVAFSWH